MRCRCAEIYVKLCPTPCTSSSSLPKKVGAGELSTGRRRPIARERVTRSHTFCYNMHARFEYERRLEIVMDRYVIQLCINIHIIKQNSHNGVLRGTHRINIDSK